MFSPYKASGKDINLLRKAICLVVNSVTVANFVAYLTVRRCVGPQM